MEKADVRGVATLMRRLECRANVRGRRMVQAMELRAVRVAHRKPVFTQPRFAAASLLYPPYGKVYESVLALLRRLNG